MDGKWLEAKRLTRLGKQQLDNKQWEDAYRTLSRVSIRTLHVHTCLVDSRPMLTPGDTDRDLIDGRLGLQSNGHSPHARVGHDSKETPELYGGRVQRSRPILDRESKIAHRLLSSILMTRCVHIRSSTIYCRKTTSRPCSPLKRIAWTVRKNALRGTPSPNFERARRAPGGSIWPEDLFEAGRCQQRACITPSTSRIPEYSTLR